MTPLGKPGAGRVFPVTSWSLVRHLKEADPAQRTAHLQRLIALYWEPVFGVIRRTWNKSADDAKDLTQEFFATTVLDGDLVADFAPDRGSFRAFLRGALTNFLRNRVRDARTIRRGGRVELVSLDAGGLDLLDGVPEGARNPDQVFDTLWTKLVMRRALARLREYFDRLGRRRTWELFERYDLGPHDDVVSYADLGKPLGLSADQVKHALVEARTTFRDLVTELLREYVDGPEELRREVRALMGG